MKKQRDLTGKINLSHIEDDAQLARILEMMSKRQEMWNGHLGTIRATEHSIESESRMHPIRQMPYRQGPAKREIIHDHIDAILREGVIEQSQSEWASRVVLAP